MAKILIVEDDELIWRMYEQVLRFRGHSVEIAVNGLEGLDKAQSTKPDIMLLDIMMPKLNGLEMLHKLKELPGAKDIRVMVLTNLMGAQDAERALQAGAIRYVVKSDYSAKEVADIVEKLLKEPGHKTAKAA